MLHETGRLRHLADACPVMYLLTKSENKVAVDEARAAGCRLLRRLVAEDANVESIPVPFPTSDVNCWLRAAADPDTVPCDDLVCALKVLSDIVQSLKLARGAL